MTRKPLQNADHIGYLLKAGSGLLKFQSVSNKSPRVSSWWQRRPEHNDSDIIRFHLLIGCKLYLTNIWDLIVTDTRYGWVMLTIQRQMTDLFPGKYPGPYFHLDVAWQYQCQECTAVPGWLWASCDWSGLASSVSWLADGSPRSVVTKYSRRRRHWVSGGRRRSECL